MTHGVLVEGFSTQPYVPGTHGPKWGHTKSVGVSHVDCSRVSLTVLGWVIGTRGQVGIGLPLLARVPAMSDDVVRDAICFATIGRVLVGTLVIADHDPGTILRAGIGARYTVATRDQRIGRGDWQSMEVVVGFGLCNPQNPVSSVQPLRMIVQIGKKIERRSEARASRVRVVRSHIDYLQISLSPGTT